MQIPVFISYLSSEARALNEGSTSSNNMNDVILTSSNFKVSFSTAQKLCRRWNWHSKIRRWISQLHRLHVSSLKGLCRKVRLCSSVISHHICQISIALCCYLTNSGATFRRACTLVQLPEVNKHLSFLCRYHYIDKHNFNPLFSAWFFRFSDFSNFW